MINLSSYKQKIVIFDFDETLVTLNLDWSVYMSSLIGEMSKIDPEITSKYSPAKLDHNLANDMIRRYGSKAREIDLQISEDFEQNKLEGYEVHKDIFDQIKNNTGKFKFYIWSTNTKPRIESILKEIGMFNLFTGIITKNDVELTKPFPDGFYKINEIENLERKDYMFIGNNPQTDELAASSCGIEFRFV